MRDIALTLIMISLLLATLRRPWVGAMLWAWLSLMNPHRMTYGFAYDLPWAYMTALVTLVAMLFSKQTKRLPMNGGVILVLLLWGWMTLTSFTSISPPSLVWERWIFVSKIQVMLLATLMLLSGRKQIDTLVWVVTGSVAYFGIKGGVFTLATGGSYRVWGPPGSMLEENNALAVALLIVLPMIYYLYVTATRRWLRIILAVSMALVAVSALGSQSRGALLALLAMAFMLGLKSKHPVRFSIALAVIIGGAISFMPDSWFERMDTISTYHSDDSAMERLYAWNTMWNVAKDRPLVGAGFHADTIDIYNRYAPSDAKYQADFGTAWVAHSIYFQAMAEHGFVGLGLFVGIWIWVWIAAGRNARAAEKIPEFQPWMPTLMRMCQVSTVAYCSGGAFLALMNLDLPLYLLAFVTLCGREIEARKALPAPAAALSGAAA